MLPPFCQCCSKAFAPMATVAAVHVSGEPFLNEGLSVRADVPRAATAGRGDPRTAGGDGAVRPERHDRPRRRASRTAELGADEGHARVSDAKIIVDRLWRVSGQD